MMPGNYPLNLYRGDDAFWAFVLWADEAKTVPVDLTGFTVKAEAREKPSGVVIVEFATQITLPNYIYMSISGVYTRALPSAGRWDLQLTDAAGTVATILAGPVKVTGDVTDSTIAADKREASRTRGYLTEPAT